LGYEVRKKGASHDCLDDACATMKLVLAKIKHGVDKPFPLTLVQEPVSHCIVYFFQYRVVVIQLNWLVTIVITVCCSLILGFRK
jgi:hypothetical protein